MDGKKNSGNCLNTKEKENAKNGGPRRPEEVIGKIGKLREEDGVAHKGMSTT